MIALAGKSLIGEDVEAAYFVLRVLEMHVLLLHCADNDLEGVDQIGEDHDPPLLPITLSEAAGVQHAHLFQHCRFATLTGTFGLIASVSFVHACEREQQLA